jgi:hypothetical protein
VAALKGGALEEGKEVTAKATLVQAANVEAREDQSEEEPVHGENDLNYKGGETSLASTF